MPPQAFVTIRSRRGASPAGTLPVRITLRKAMAAFSECLAVPSYKMVHTCFQSSHCAG